MHISNSQLIACLTAFLAAIPSASAAPVPGLPVISGGGGGKRLALWDWTNTRDASSVPGLQQSAQSIADPGSKIFAVMNWGTKPPAEIPAGFRFQPMVRNLDDLNGDSWQSVLGLAANNDKKIVHFLNEPELNGISVEQALAGWRSQMVPLRQSTGALLVSPATSSSPAGTAWTQQFMSQLGPQEKPDFLGTHFYTLQDTPAEQEVANCKAFLEQRFSSFGIPLAVGEIGSTSRDPTSVQTFTQQMADYMDSNDNILEYGFFGASRTPSDGFVSPAAQLLGPDGIWTALGKWLLSN